MLLDLIKPFSRLQPHVSSMPVVTTSEALGISRIQRTVSLDAFETLYKIRGWQSISIPKLLSMIMLCSGSDPNREVGMIIAIVIRVEVDNGWKDSIV